MKSYRDLLYLFLCIAGLAVAPTITRADAPTTATIHIAAGQLFEDVVRHAPHADLLIVTVEPGHNIGRVYVDRDIIIRSSDPPRRYRIAPAGQPGKKGVKALADIDRLELHDFHATGWDGAALHEQRGDPTVKNLAFHNFIVAHCDGQGALLTNKTHANPVIMRNGVFYQCGGPWPKLDVGDRAVYAERPVDAENVLLAFNASDEQLRAGGTMRNVTVIGSPLVIGQVLGNKNPIDEGVDVELDRVSVLFARQGRGIVVGNIKSMQVTGDVSILYPNITPPTLKKSRAWRVIGAEASGGGIGVHNVAIDARATVYIDPAYTHEVVIYGQVADEWVQALNVSTPWAPTGSATDRLDALQERIEAMIVADGDVVKLLAEIEAFPNDAEPEPAAVQPR